MIKPFLFFICLLWAQAVSAQEKADTLFPKPIGWVNDFEDILDDATEDQLNYFISSHEQKTTDQISVVTISSIKPYKDFEMYALALSKSWGTGTKEKNNGVTIVFSKTLRNVRISTGTGLEKKLTDAQCKRIIDELMIPAFKEGEYSDGVTAAVQEIIRVLEASE